MYSCQPCNVALNSQEQLNQHQAGKSHAKKLNRLGIVVPATEQQGQNENFVPKYGGAFVSPQCTQKLVDEVKESIKDDLSTATTPEDFNSILSKQFNASIPPPPPPPPAPVTKEGNKPAKRKFTEIYCDVCHVNINSDSQAQQHFQGQKHNKKMKLISVVTEGEATSTTDDCGQKKITTHFCQFCNISVNSLGQLEVHRSGSKHKKNIEKLQTKSSPVEPQASVEEPSFSFPNNQSPCESYVSTS